MLKFFRRIRYDLMEKSPISDKSLRHPRAAEAPAEGARLRPSENASAGMKSGTPASRTGRYLKYAIGEIILVVFGILIALQINNWNENRKSRNSEIVKLNKLTRDLRLDSLNFDQSLKILSEVERLHKQLYNIGVKGADENLMVNPSSIRKYIFYNPSSLNNSKLVVNGLSNEIIRDQLLDYINELERGFVIDNEFTTAVKIIRSYLSQKEAYNLSSVLESQIDVMDKNLVLVTEQELIKLSKNKDFQQLIFEANFKLNALVQSLQENTINNDVLKKLISKELKEY